MSDVHRWIRATPTNNATSTFDDNDARISEFDPNFVWETFLFLAVFVCAIRCYKGRTASLQDDEDHPTLSRATTTAESEKVPDFAKLLAPFTMTVTQDDLLFLGDRISSSDDDSQAPCRCKIDEETETQAEITKEETEDTSSDSSSVSKTETDESSGAGASLRATSESTGKDGTNASDDKTLIDGDIEMGGMSDSDSPAQSEPPAPADDESATGSIFAENHGFLRLPASDCENDENDQDRTTSTDDKQAGGEDNDGDSNDGDNNDGDKHNQQGEDERSNPKCTSLHEMLHTNDKSQRLVPCLCAICLCPYEVGQQVSWSTSTTNKCQHAFHTECILEFANTKVKSASTFASHGVPCPLCRQPFIS